MSPPWILRRLANVSPFFNSLSNRLRITNYCLRSVSSSLLKFTRFIQGNNIAWTILIWSGIYNTCIWIRSPIPIKYYLLIVIEFFPELKVSCGLSNNTHCKLLMAKVNIPNHSEIKWWQLNIWQNFKANCKHSTGTNF